MIIVDGLRIIENTNTQVRYLPILLEMLKRISDNLTPIQLLKEKMVNWSSNEEQQNSNYNDSQGKLTQNGKATQAFPYYLSFLQSLNWVQTTGDFIKTNKYGNIIKLLQAEKSENLEWQKFLLLYYLFEKDADNLLTILDFFKKSEKPITDKILRQNYYQALYQRLSLKSKFATQYSELKIREKFIEVYKYQKQNIQSKGGENKHLVSPRLAWLVYLGIIQSENQVFTLTEKGLLFYEVIPNLDENTKDVNNLWLEEHLLKSYTNTQNILYQHISNFEELEIQKIIGKLLLDLYNQMYNDEAMRISLLPALIYIILFFVINHQITTDFTDIENILKNDLIHKDIKFSLKKTARLNESYIALKLI
jgi:predicted transcriptional regulator